MGAGGLQRNNIVDGMTKGDGLGTKTSMADMDGDGLSDAVVGAGFTDINGGSSGSVYLIPGS